MYSENLSANQNIFNLSVAVLFSLYAACLFISIMPCVCMKEMRWYFLSWMAAICVHCLHIFHLSFFCLYECLRRSQNHLPISVSFVLLISICLSNLKFSLVICFQSSQHFLYIQYLTYFTRYFFIQWSVA